MSSIIVRRGQFSDLRDIIHYAYSKREAERDARRWYERLRDHNPRWENRNDSNRLAIEVGAEGFVVKFDGHPVFQYVGRDVSTALPKLSLSPVREDRFELSFDGSFWALFGTDYNGGQPVVFTPKPDSQARLF
jgi:hypothetical protein